MAEYVNGTTDILGGSVIRYALNTTTPNQAVIRKIIAGNGITISSTGVDAGTGDVTISVEITGSGGGTGGGTGGGESTGIGTVTSVNMTVPEGLTVYGAPITTAGTIALRLSSGYTIPLYVDVQKGIDAYDNTIMSFSYNTSSGIITLTQRDGGSITTSITLDPFTTSDLVEGTNLYYTDARVRLAISETITGIDYNSTTGVFSLSSGYVIPTTIQESNWTAAYNDKINSFGYNTSTGVLTLTQQDGGTLTASVTLQPFTTDNLTEGSTNLYFTQARARGSVSAGTGISYNSSTGVITNSAPDQTVVLTAGAGISISGTYPSFTIASTITQYTDALARAAISETITGIDYNSSTGVFSLTAGYVIPTTTQATNWDTTYGWGNHATAGYQLLSEKGQPNGYASLDGGGKVPSAQLPSYVDDVLEYANLATFPVTGETGKIYVTLDTNKTYRWTGSAYVEIAQGNVGTVTQVSVVSANGFAGTVANNSSTPAITLTTTVTGILKGNGTAISAAVANTDYQSPITLTTTGTSGAATFNGTTLNIPQYSDTNIYNSDGTLTGDRTVTMSTRSLSFSGSDFAIKMFSTGRFSINRSTSPLGLLHIQKAADSTEAHLFLSTPYPSTTPTSIIFQNNDFGSTGIGTGTFSWDTAGAGFEISHELTIKTGNLITSAGDVRVPQGYGFYFGGGEYIKHSGAAGGYHIDIYTSSGQQRARFTNGGNFIIGSAASFADSGFRMDVQGTGRFKLSAAGSTTPLRIENGTSGSSVNLELVGGPLASTAASVILQGTDLGGWAQALTIRVYDGTAGGAGAMLDRYQLAKDYFNLLSINQVKQTGTNGIDNIWIATGADNLNHLSGISFNQYKKSAIYHIVSTSGTWGVGDLAFAVNNVTTSQMVSVSDEKMRLTRAGNLLINTTTDIASSIFTLASTTKGFLPPRMTETQRTAISSPAEGLIVVQTDGTQGLYIYINATWRALTMV